MDKLILALVLIGIISGQLVQIPIGGFDIPLLDITLGLAVLVGLYYVIKQGTWKKIVSFYPFKIFLLFVGILLLSLLINVSHYNLGELIISSLFWVRLTAYGFLAFIIFASFPKKSSLPTTWWLWGFATVAGLGFIQLVVVPSLECFEYLGWDPHQNRLFSTFLDPNFVGIFLSIGAGWALLSLLKPKLSNQKFNLAVLLAVIALAVLFTFSRSALLALVVILGVVAFIFRRQFLFIGLGLLVVVMLFSPRLQERISGIWQLDVTVRHRIESWNHGLNMVEQNPLLGVGYNALQFRRDEFASAQEEVGARAASGFDSSLLTIAATSGFIGLIAFLWFVILNVRITLRKLATDYNSFFSPLFLATSAGLFFASFFVNAWFYPPILITWFVILGLSWKEIYD